MAIAKHVIFTGFVQGVGFRFTANSVAKRYELKGYVRNMDDGTVEMHLQGEEQDINDCIEDLKETFTIKNVKIEPADVNTLYKGFSIAF